MKTPILISALIFISAIIPAKGQSIRTAMPFLKISPDAKSSAVGETGVATTPDLNSMYWNNAKLAFLPGEYGVSASYVPWLTQIKSGITSMYLTGFRKLDETQTMALSINYFTLGNVNLYDEVGNDVGKYNPSEYSVELGYGRQLSENMGMGITLKYLHSDMATGQTVGSANIKAASTAAMDFGFYYHNVTSENNAISYGIFLSNIGPKIKLPSENDASGQFLPMNLRFGTQYHIESGTSDDAFNLSFDINKALTPTPPIYKKDAYGNDTKTIIAGYDPDKSVPGAIFGSFVDAPGGFGQQVKQFTAGFGSEYAVQNKFFFRAGFHYENLSVGDMTYATTGFGYASGSIHADMSYLIPFNSLNQYKNTFRITLGFSLIPEK